ncbi:hypothetical protein [Pseudorhodoferax sp. Leaf274]|uniref:hypothetical protein n=1 Tax=Pseudorhodoferax sp. Leaf274 TaxID=1736318 RepID=UPI0012E22DE9|nr:hypothetical protein [Pseudorhodoferax sp. Leaf274]
MPSPHDAPPSASSFVTSALHEGQQFMQRLAGRGAVWSDASPQAPEAAEGHGDWPDLDQRVRAVGEW